MRFSSIRRVSKAFICASARWLAAACAGPTGRRTSAPRFSAWSRHSRSRMPSSCRSAPKAASCPNACRRPPIAMPGWRKALKPIASSFARCSNSPIISMVTRSCRPTTPCGTMAMTPISSSPATRLVAAFEHRDIFIDPPPDPAISHAERLRMFSLPRSSWQDYDKSLISQGGGVFSRSLKAIPLALEVRALLDLGKPQVTPSEVMTAILKARVDLLWFGGIGTYIRASGESDDHVGDRANDPIRVVGADVRARVIGEGANLGATQRGRVEAAQKGIKLNTDAIDNSAGVNTSDVEVNLKIALARPERDGRLGQNDRNSLLAAMTDEVGTLVLRNNYLQTLALSLAERKGLAETGFLTRLMQSLEQRGLLDRAVEFLPDDVAIAERTRRGQPFTRPELAVLLAYAKLTLYEDLLLTSVP